MKKCLPACTRPAGGRRRVLGATAAICAVLAATLHAGGTDDPAPSPAAAKMSGVTQFHPAFPATGLTALADDQLLFWHGNGRAQLRRKNGELTPVFQLPMKAVMAVQADADGFLALGTSAPGTAAVVKMTAAGNETGRWTLPGLDAYGLFAGARGPSALTRTGVVTLLPDGKVSVPEPLPAGQSTAYGPLPVVLAGDGITVVWRASDLSMQHQSKGSCERLGEAGWKVEGDFMSPPVRCGRWLVFAEPAGSDALTVRSLESGAVESQIAGHPRAVVASDSSGTLVVGDRQLSIIELPGGKAIWTAPLAGSRVTALAVMHDSIAYRVEDSPDIMLVAR